MKSSEAEWATTTSVIESKVFLIRLFFSLILADLTRNSSVAHFVWMICRPFGQSGHLRYPNVRTAAWLAHKMFQLWIPIHISLARCIALMKEEAQKQNARESESKKKTTHTVHGTILAHINQTDCYNLCFIVFGALWSSFVDLITVRRWWANVIWKCCFHVIFSLLIRALA